MLAPVQRSHFSFSYIWLIFYFFCMFLQLLFLFSSPPPSPFLGISNKIYKWCVFKSFLAIWSTVLADLTRTKLVLKMCVFLPGQVVQGYTYWLPKCGSRESNFLTITVTEKNTAAISKHLPVMCRHSNRYYLLLWIPWPNPSLCEVSGTEQWGSAFISVLNRPGMPRRCWSLPSSHCTYDKIDF